MQPRNPSRPFVYFGLFVLVVIGLVAWSRHRNAVEEVAAAPQSAAPVSTWEAAGAAPPDPVAAEATPAMDQGDEPKKVLTQEEIDAGKW